nr:MAG TPA: hypothetical protein [Caudoviricetes sp.]
MDHQQKKPENTVVSGFFICFEPLYTMCNF